MLPTVDSETLEFNSNKTRILELEEYYRPRSRSSKRIIDYNVANISTMTSLKMLFSVDIETSEINSY